MLLRRFYERSLAQASYMVGCQATGEAIVVDPNRDVDVYLRAAEDEGMTIRQVTETHIHADFLSGARELARRSGATLLLSAEGDDDWQYAFAEEEGARLLRDGDEIRVGNVTLGVLHTPGHTPEHLTFSVTDGAASDRPMGLITGDFLFVGDVGRPDLLERAAGMADTMEEGARRLWASLERVRSMPDYLQIFPGHGAGSACGKALGAVPTSTLGYEKLVGWAFRCRDEQEFVQKVLEDQPEPPRYFARMKGLNRDGPPLLGTFPVPARAEPGSLAAALERGEPVVDLRHRDEVAEGHVPGTLNIGWGQDFTTWAGWLLPYDRPVHLLAEERSTVQAAVRQLALIGIDRIGAWYGLDALEAWEGSGGALRGTTVVDWPATTRAVEDEEALLVDVRSESEWNEGHVPGALHVHLGSLAEASDSWDRNRPVVLYCRSGNRSSIGASLLEGEGFTDVRHVEGGIRARPAEEERTAARA